MNETQAKERIAMLLLIAQSEGYKNLADAGAEAIKALDVKKKLRQEIQKLEQEAGRCYAVANENALYRLDATANVWTARANAIRDCIGVVKDVLGG